jgi:hypothetical protein
VFGTGKKQAQNILKLCKIIKLLEILQIDAKSWAASGDYFCGITISGTICYVLVTGR